MTGDQKIIHKVRAPDVDRPGFSWFNTKTPLSLEKLRGRLVILDFWTFCCINCLHVLPALRQVEETFPEFVTVIGVHSPKFSAERDDANLAAAIARYDIRHPVLQDRNRSLWQDYAVRAWPTLVFISPDGYVVGHYAGEPDAKKLLQATGKLLQDAADKATLDPTPLSPSASELSLAAGRLSFPAKIKSFIAASGEQSWVVADSGHNRVLILNQQGQEVHHFGGFRRPEGVAAADGMIFVADTGNHAIHQIDIVSGAIRQIAGMGRRGGAITGAVTAKDTSLASPWDLALDGSHLYIANAGTHQILALDLITGILTPAAGTGVESLRDGRAHEAYLAQPSALALDQAKRRLYFADSETSAIRYLTLDANPEVVTLVGEGLFDFGHVNGPLKGARLQHPLGLAVNAEELLVADSYNGCIRQIDLNTDQIEDFDIDFTCADSVCLPLAEPAGIATSAKGTVLVCDTNNHRILRYDRETKTYRSWFF